MGKAETKPSASRTTYTTDKADKVIDLVSSGVPLAQVCRDMSIGLRTWYGWCDARPELLARFVRAREDGEDAIAVDCLRIADTPAEAIIEKSSANGVEITRQDALGHRKLQIETRLRLLAKWNPRKWGDKVQHGGADDLPPVRTESLVTLDPSEAYKLLLGGK